MSKKPVSTKKKVTKSVSADLDFAFYNQLQFFYQDQKGYIRTHFKDLSKKFLDFNEPSRHGSFLRRPQFEALEIYVFLKEFADNTHLHNLFEQWHNREGVFKNRNSGISRHGQMSFVDEITADQYKAVLSKMKANKRLYPNYIFALTMGTGKTILMATCIYYEFILANKFPADKRFCHNALVFAPDRTVLQSLKEIQTFDLSKVVPPEYVNFLTAHIQFHFLEDAGTTLSVLDKSRFNIVISNTQKIILKRDNKGQTAAETLFSSGKQTHKVIATSAIDDVLAEFAGEDEPLNEGELTSNQRFEKLKRLDQLGVFVDEAHHAFGDALAKDMGIKSPPTSLRVTIDQLAAALRQSGANVVACYNYTGTPYVGREVLPEVVYAYGLKDAIENGYLKKVVIDDYKNVKSGDFVADVINDFVSEFKKKRFEGMLPKLAFFATDIEELQKKLKPAVEEALASHGISLDRILVNVGDDKLTTNDDIREFNKLDTPESKKQFILLVNKGREGWNCRSLFGVALHRSPKSKIFVLQATMRCLRSIGEGQQTGRVYLSSENLEILDNELKQNFRISTEELREVAKEKRNIHIKPVPPPVKIPIRRVRRTYEIKEKSLREGIDLGLSSLDKEKYRSVKTRRTSLEGDENVPGLSLDLSSKVSKVEFSEMTLVAEVSRYLNKSPLLIEDVLESTKDGIELILETVNEFNDVLYDEVIPKLFKEMYDLSPKEESEVFDIELIKQPPIDPGYYEVRASDEMVVSVKDKDVAPYKDKSFHVDHYCFDSKPEKTLFWDLLREDRVKSVWFTGMLTHGQSDFFIQYIDPETHSVRSYYPDFIYIDAEGTYNIVEVKGDNMMDDSVVLAKKAYAEKMTEDSGMTYKMIKGSEVMDRQYRKLLE